MVSYNWNTDWDDYITDPDDGEGYITFWKDGMKPEDVLELLKYVYRRAYAQGFDEAVNQTLDNI